MDESTTRILSLFVINDDAEGNGASNFGFSIANSLRLLLKSRNFPSSTGESSRFLPIFPYKILLQTILRDEAAAGSSSFHLMIYLYNLLMFRDFK